MTLVLDVLGLTIRLGGLVIVLAFTALATFTAVDWLRELGRPVCRRCGARHHGGHP